MKNIISFILQRSKGLICNYSSKLGIILYGLLIISAIFIIYYFNLWNYCLKLFISKKKIKPNNRYLSSSTSNSNNFNFNYNRYKWYGLLHMILLMIMSEIFSFKSILFIYIIITIIYLIYLLLDLYIFILYINKKITTPSYFPNYLRNWLIEKEERSQLEVEGLRGFVDLHVRNILVYILSLLIIITIYILL